MGTIAGQLGLATLGLFVLGGPSLATSGGAQTITMGAAVAGPRSIPTPGLIGSNQQVTMAAAVAGPRAIAAPVVAGPVTMNGTVGPNRFIRTPAVSLRTIALAAAVAGPRAIPTPRMNVRQAITVAAAVAGPRAIAAPIVAHVTVVYLAAAVAGPRAIPEPEVFGSDQYVSVYPVQGRRAIPPPSIAGGSLYLGIYIGGVDRTEYLGWEQGQFTIEGQTIGRWKGNFALYQGEGISGFMPEVGMTFLCIDHSFRIMAGCVTDVELNRLLSTENSIWYEVEVADKSAICDHRIIRGQTYAAGSDVVTVILQIHSQALDGEGIDVSLIPPAGTFGTLASDLVCNFRTVTTAYDDICTRSGLVWWIDSFSRLRFSSFVDLPSAPFDLTEDSENWRGPDGPESGGGLRVKWTLKDYFNVLYAVSNLTILPGGGGGGTGGAGAGVTETFTWTPDGPGIATITNSSGARVAVGIIASAAIGAVQSLTVDGVTQTVVDFGRYAGQTPAPPDLLWFWGGPATGTPGAQVGPSVLPTNGQTIVITYTAAVTAAASTAQYGTALDPVVEGQPIGTCGSGRYEGVIQVQDISSQSELNAIAAAHLSRIGGVPRIVRFQTDVPGLVPGQKLYVDLPLSGLDGVSLLITSVSGYAIPPVLHTGAAFRWTVEARSNLDPGNWLKWYERLVGRTANALPVPQFEEGSFVAGGGSVVSGGVNITNPYIVKRTGKLVEMLVAASNPPIGQDLLLTVTLNGSTLIGSITLPSTALPNQVIVYTFPATANLYVFSRDTLNVDATYIGGGGMGTPIRASGVTLAVRWTM